MDLDITTTAPALTLTSTAPTVIAPGEPFRLIHPGSPRAVYFNTEIGVVVNAPELAAEMTRTFEQRIDEVAFRLELKTDEKGTQKLLWHGLVDGQPKTFDHEPYATLWQRFFPIESQL